MLLMLSRLLGRDLTALQKGIHLESATMFNSRMKDSIEIRQYVFNSLDLCFTLTYLCEWALLFAVTF